MGLLGILPLVHYRNLLEFFGRKPKPSDKTDLTIWRPELIWARHLDFCTRCPNESDLLAMRQAGSELWIKYEDRNKRRDTISRYLQHCTTFRTEFKQWNPHEMMGELNGTLELFESHLPDFRPASNSDVLEMQ